MSESSLTYSIGTTPVTEVELLDSVVAVLVSFWLNRKAAERELDRQGL